LKAAAQIAFDFAAPASQPAAPRATEPENQAVSASARAAELERALRARVGLPLRLTITDNRRTMLSLKRRHGTEGVEVRLHHMFLHGDPSLWSALSDYLFDGERSAAQIIGRYIERHRERIRRELRRPIALYTTGVHHDLAEIYAAVNRQYFADRVEAHITWGRDPAKRKQRSRRSIKLGSYTSRDRLIRVHPALDASFVPRFFIEYIVYHEMLHHVLPPKLQSGRRELHGPTFKAREREFHHYDAALRWEREHLDRLLRQRPPKPVPAPARTRTPVRPSAQAH
jgi:predicted metal-dependent hydrolase